MIGKTFIDTNILIYAHDTDAGAKHQIARIVLRALWSERTGALSPQVLQEFYVNVTRKIFRLPVEGFGTPGGEHLRNLVYENHAN